MRKTDTPNRDRTGEAELSSLLDTLPHLISRVALDGTVTYASGAARELLGREPEELVGTNAADLVDTADRAEIERKLASLAVAEVGAQERITARLRRADGSLTWVDGEARVVLDPRTGERELVTVSQRSTDRVETQRALARVEERYRELVEWLPAIVYESEQGPQGAFDYVSPQVEDLLGYTPDEWVADRHLWFNRVHPDDRDRAVREEEELAERARSSDRRIASEYRMLHRDGSVVWIRDIARLCDPDGARPFWRGVLIDISVEHSAQQALAAAHARHRTMVEGLPACVYRAEPQAMGRWEYISPQIERLLGYTPQEWSADPTLWRASLHADDRERVELEEQRHATAGPGTEFVSEYRLRHRSGRVIWVRDRAVVTLGPTGRPIIDGILTDISAERAAAAGAEMVDDVYRLTCGDCGATWAADRIERCRECRSESVEAVSMNAALADLAGSRQQVEGLLDGIQRHLDALGTNLRAVSDQFTDHDGPPPDDQEVEASDSETA